MILVTEVEDFGDALEGIQSIGGGYDQTFEVALAGTKYLPEITLLCLRRYASGGSRPHHVDEYHRDLHHCRRAHGLSHQREAAPGRSGHGAGAHMGCPDGHVGDCNLVLALANHNVEFSGILRHPMQDASRGAHRVGCVELYTCGCATHGQGGVAGPKRERLGPASQRFGVGFEVLFGVFVSGAGRVSIFLDDGVPLATKLKFQCVL